MVGCHSSEDRRVVVYPHSPSIIYHGHHDDHYYRSRAVRLHSRHVRPVIHRRATPHRRGVTHRRPASHRRHDVHRSRTHKSRRNHRR